MEGVEDTDAEDPQLRILCNGSGSERQGLARGGGIETGKRVLGFFFFIASQ